MEVLRLNSIRILRRCVFSGCILASALPGLAQGRGPAPVVAAIVEERDLHLGESFLGTILPSRMSVVGSRVEGAVSQFLVAEGDRVEKGQALAELSSRLLELELAGARAELELSKKQLEELENGARPEELSEAHARVAGALSLRDYARANLKRTQELFAQDMLASRNALDEAISLTRNAEQVHLVVLAAFEMVENGPRVEVLEQARARVLSRVEGIHRLEFLIGNHTIRAPFDGIITAEHTEIGSWVVRGGPVVDITDLSEVDVRVFVPERWIAGLSPGVMATIEIPALFGRSFSARVSAIIPIADAKTREFPVKISLVNLAGDAGEGFLLKAGMTASARLPVFETKKALLVPKDALVLGGPAPLVYVIDGSSSETLTVRPVPVSVGLASGDRVVVTGLVEPGDRVVVRGNERLRPGQEVRVIGGEAGR